MANFFLDHERLIKGAEELGLSLSADQLAKLDQYASILYKWNKTYNLTSIEDKDSVLNLHILDSLASVPVFNEYLSCGSRLLDVGSGGGLPGVPLAIMFPNCNITLVDTVGKKTAFLTQVALNLKLNNVQVIHNRVEKLNRLKYDVITSRAFSSLDNFVFLTRHLISANGHWIALKGQYPEEELVNLASDIKYHIIDINVPFLNQNRTIAILSNR